MKEKREGGDRKERGKEKRKKIKENVKWSRFKSFFAFFVLVVSQLVV